MFLEDAWLSLHESISPIHAVCIPLWQFQKVISTDYNYSHHKTTSGAPLLFWKCRFEGGFWFLIEEQPDGQSSVVAFLFSRRHNWFALMSFPLAMDICVLLYLRDKSTLKSCTWWRSICGSASSWYKITRFIPGNSQSIAKIPTISATFPTCPFHVTLWVFRRKLQARSGKHITATQPTANNILHKQVLTLWQPEIARLREAMCGSGPGLRGCQARAVLVPTLLIHNSKKKIMAIHRWNWVVPRWWRWRVQVVSLPMFGVSGCMPCVVSGNLWLVFLAEAMSQMTYIY